MKKVLDQKTVELANDLKLMSITEFSSFTIDEAIFTPRGDLSRFEGTVTDSDNKTFDASFNPLLGTGHANAYTSKGVNFEIIERIKL